MLDACDGEPTTLEGLTMARTIGTLAYKVVMNTQGLKDGTVATRREISAAKAIIEQTTPATERLSTALAGLEQMERKGLLTTEQLARAQESLKKEFESQIAPVNATSASVQKGGSFFDQYGAKIATAVTVVGALRVAQQAVSYTIGVVTDNVSAQIEKLDDLIATSSKLGIAAGAFQEMGHAAALADISQQELGNGMEKMLGSISKAAGGSKKLADVFKMLGLDASALKQMGPEEALTEITKALEQIPDRADKVRAAMAIFGSGDFLRLDTDQLQVAADLFDKMGGGLSDLDVSIFNEFDDAMVTFNGALDQSWQKLTVALLPALTEMAEVGTDVLIALTGEGSGFAETVTWIADAIVGAVTVTKEFAAEVYNTANAFGILDDAASVLRWWSGADMASPLVEIGKQQREAAAVAREAAAEKRKALAEEQAILKEQIAAEEEAVQAQERMAEAHQKTIDKLKEEVETFGMSQDEIDLYRLAKEGASQAVLDEAAALQKQVQQMKDAEAAQKKAVADELASADAAKKKIMDRLDEDRKRREAMANRPVGAGAIIAGSQEALRFAAEWARKTSDSGDQKRDVRKSREALEKIVEKLTDGLVDTTVVGSL